MPELGTPGSVRGVLSNEHPYRDLDCAPGGNSLAIELLEHTPPNAFLRHWRFQALLYVSDLKNREKITDPAAECKAILPTLLTETLRSEFIAKNRNTRKSAEAFCRQMKRPMRKFPRADIFLFVT
ncbi:hypothetical protein [Paraburkholderia aspalathi]|uniref:hypothetical protein n=1 Tax=Paraburkholderia aspalathi TaxID=1324617 RepID=UPI00142DE217|nr:hypothetical protein [Paraburkholderia aspalathi]